jgi:hypothetical protein
MSLRYVRGAGEAAGTALTAADHAVGVPRLAQLGGRDENILLGCAILMDSWSSGGHERC